MTRYVGVLTAGGDTPGLNAALRALGKSSHSEGFDMQLIGFYDGFRGLLHDRRPPRGDGARRSRPPSARLPRRGHRRPAGGTSDLLHEDAPGRMMLAEIPLVWDRAGSGSGLGELTLRVRDPGLAPGSPHVHERAGMLALTMMLEEA